MTEVIMVELKYPTPWCHWGWAVVSSCTAVLWKGEYYKYNWKATVNNKAL